MFTDAPWVAEHARNLARDAELLRLLDTPIAPEDAAALVEAIDHAQPALTGLLCSQQQVTHELKRLADRR